MNPTDRTLKTQRRLRILLVGPVPPPMGGIVRYAQDLMNSELAIQHEMTLFRDNIPSEYRPRASEEKHSWNILKRDGVIGTGKAGTFAAKRMIDLNRVFRHGRFHIMHVLSTAGYGFFRNTIHVRIARRHGVKTVFHILGQIDDLYRDGGPLSRRIISSCLNMADVLIVQSPLLAEFLRGITKQPVYSILNGVKTDEFTPPDGYAHGMSGRIRIITVGLLGQRKGTLDILEIAARLKNQWANIEFTIIGGGEINRFRERATHMGLSAQVKFLGGVDDLFRTEMLKASDIFLLPSHAEGQPIALLEAMAAGLPVISSTVGSIPEIIKEQNGFLVRPGDVDSIIKYIEILTSDKELREQMGRFNAQEAEVKYQLKRVMREINGVYLSLA